MLQASEHIPATLNSTKSQEAFKQAALHLILVRHFLCMASKENSGCEDKTWLKV